jgi:hypothetical protein
VDRMRAASQSVDVSALTGHRGYLFKKAGGKAFDKRSLLKGKAERWAKRWFVLAPGSTSLAYYRSEEKQMGGEAPLGTVECKRAVLFLKEVRAGQVYRFTVRSAARELKLRTVSGPTSSADYDAWMAALAPLTEIRDDEDDLGQMSIRDDDDDDVGFDDDEVPAGQRDSNTASRLASALPSSLRAASSSRIASFCRLSRSLALSCRSGRGRRHVRRGRRARAELLAQRRREPVRRGGEWPERLAGEEGRRQGGRRQEEGHVRKDEGGEVVA